jgi:SAM-dependent methyltransferase
MSWFTRVRVSPPVNRLRYHLYRDVLLAAPRRVACNLCGWRGRRFLSHTHKYVLCPQCGSHVRQRLIAAALEHCDRVRRLVRVEGASVLHVSPEYCLGLLFRRAAEYVRADKWTADCDITVDMTDMRDIPAQRFDILVACDVLEHIQDDGAAIREARRVLRPGGTAILTVPQFDEDRPTLEDPAIVSREDRERVYGQDDHLRNYGSDFGAKLESAGFRVTAVSAADFDPGVVRRHTLRPPVPLAAAYGWNDRRVYFGTV